MPTRFLVRGRVQGVGFRYFVAHHADALGLSGSARNLADGRVEVVVEGDAGAVSRLEALLRAGPPGALVRGVQRDEAAGDLPRAGFRVG